MSTKRLALLSGFLLACTFPPIDAWWLGWVALVPWCLAVRRSSGPIQARSAGFLMGLLAYSISLWWMVKIWWGLALLAWLLFSVFLALTSGFLKRIELGRNPPWWRWGVVAASSWFVIEVFRAEWWPLRYGMVSLGYSQALAPELRQWASVWGVYGLSWVMVLVNAWLALGWERFRRREFGWGRPTLAALVVLVVLWVGGRYLGGFPLSHRTAKVIAVQNETINLQVHERLTREAAGEQPAYIVWPEYGVELTPAWKDEALHRMAGVARDLKATLVAGCMTFRGINEPKKFENHTLVFGPNGETIGRYTKMHPIQFIEALMVRGLDATVMRSDQGMIGTPICFDMDYTDVVRKMAKGGAELILTPNMDPLTWGETEHWQRVRIAQLRALESRRWVVRAASSGVSVIVDPRGEVRHWLGVGQIGVVSGIVTLESELSPYHQWGWYAIVVAWWGAVVWYLFRSRFSTS